MRVPLIDDMTTTEPPRRARCGTAYFSVRNVPLRLMARVLSHSSGPSDAIGARTPLMPALATTTSRRPNVSTTCSTARRTCSGSETSTTTWEDLTSRADLGDELPQLGLGQVQGADPRPFLHQEPRGRLADAGAGPRDQCHLAIEDHCHFS